MQYHHTKREPEMAELIEGSERDRRRLAELLDGIRVGPGVDAMADGMREAVWADVRSRIRRRGIRMRIVRYAAAAAVMAGVVCGSWFMGGRRTESRLVAAAQPVSVSTPLGVKSDVVLPDGSRVRLNGGTRIVYPALFGDERRVEVDGEAYFEVEHDARRPFVVVTGQVVSTVLGTTFNVHAYSEDENYQITLATGSLLVDGGPESRSVRLRPGEQGILREDLRTAVAAQGERRAGALVAGGQALLPGRTPGVDRPEPRKAVQRRHHDPRRTAAQDLFHG